MSLNLCQLSFHFASFEHLKILTRLRLILVFLLITAIFDGCYTCGRLSHTIRGCFDTFEMGRSDSDARPHFFSARITGDAFTFNRFLTTAQKGNYDELKRLFRQQYQTNADLSKAQLRSLCQLAGQDVPVIRLTFRDLLGRAYTDNAVQNGWSSPHSLKALPMLLFAGKCEKLTNSVWGRS